MQRELCCLRPHFQPFGNANGLLLKGSKFNNSEEVESIHGKDRRVMAAADRFARFGDKRKLVSACLLADRLSRSASLYRAVTPVAMMST